MLELRNISWNVPDGKEVLKDITLTIPVNSEPAQAIFPANVWK